MSLRVPRGWPPPLGFMSENVTTRAPGAGSSRAACIREGPPQAPWAPSTPPRIHVGGGPA